MGWLARLLSRLFGPRPAPIPTPVPPPVPVGTTATQCLAAHNALRAAQGLYPYRPSDALNRTAQGHADWMARNDDLDHFEPGADPFQRIKAAGYLAGNENIAWNYRSAQDVSRGWTGDAGHRANVLSKQWTEAGFGLAYSRKGEPYWCADYGTKVTSDGFLAMPLPGGIRGPGLTKS